MADVLRMRRKPIDFKIGKEEYIRRCKILGINELDFLSGAFVPIDIENYDPPFKGGKVVYTYGSNYAIAADEKSCHCSCREQYCIGPCCVCARNVRVMVNGPDMDTFNLFFK